MPRLMARMASSCLGVGMIRGLVSVDILGHVHKRYGLAVRATVLKLLWCRTEGAVQHGIDSLVVRPFRGDEVVVVLLALVLAIEIRGDFSLTVDQFRLGLVALESVWMRKR